MILEETHIHHEKTVRKLLARRGFDIWKEPSGNANDFPDVGASIDIDGTPLNLHIEVKGSKDTTMGQIRNWVYKDGMFSATKITSPNTALMIDILNSIPEAGKKADYILKQLRKYFSRKVDELSQSSLLVIKDVEKRNEKLHDFMDNYEGSYHIISQASSEYGQLILEHYRSKFVPRPGMNVLMFAIDRQLFLVDMPSMPGKRKIRTLCQHLGVDNLPLFPENFTAAIECRISPSTLEGRGQVRLDTVLRLRATGLSRFTGPLLT